MRYIENSRAKRCQQQNETKSIRCRTRHRFGSVKTKHITHAGCGLFRNIKESTNKALILL
jgi:hypothetical protein